MRVRKRMEDAMLLTLKMEEGAVSQRMQMVPRSWKRAGDAFSPTAFKRNSPAKLILVQ